jgi:hypothetical protein
MKANDRIMCQKVKILTHFANFDQKPPLKTKTYPIKIVPLVVPVLKRIFNVG